MATQDSASGALAPLGLPGADDLGTGRLGLQGGSAGPLGIQGGVTGQLGFRNARERQLAHALGLFGTGLGLAQLLAPGVMQRLVGVRDHGLLMRLLGARELASSFGILQQPKPAPFLWSRVGGDAMDVALLVAALMSPRARRGRVGLALLAVLGVAALDLLSSQQTSRHPRAVEKLPRSSRIEVEKSVSINKSPAECYAFWRRLENLPQFMQHLESVKETDERRSHWVAKAPAIAGTGGKVEWDAEIIDDRPDRLLTWTSIQGSQLPNAGEVRFDPAPGGRGTIVRARLNYEPPIAPITSLLAKLFGEDPEQQVQEDLRRFKRIMEAGELPTTEGQPAGQRSSVAKLAANLRP